MVCHSDHKYRLQRLVICFLMFSDDMSLMFSDSMLWKSRKRLKKGVSPHKTPLLIRPLTQPELVEYLKRKGLLPRMVAI